MLNIDSRDVRVECPFVGGDAVRDVGRLPSACLRRNSLSSRVPLFQDTAVRQ